MWCTVGLFEEFNEGIGQLVPKFAFPQVFQAYEDMLKAWGSFFSLFGKKVGNCVDIHSDRIQAFRRISAEHPVDIDYQYWGCLGTIS